MTPKTWNLAVACAKLGPSGPSSKYRLSLYITWDSCKLARWFVTVQSGNGNDINWVTQLSIYCYKILLSTMHKFASRHFKFESLSWDLSKSLYHIIYMYSLLLLFLSDGIYLSPEYYMFRGGRLKIWTDPTHPQSQTHYVKYLLSLITHWISVHSVSLLCCWAHIWAHMSLWRMWSTYIPSIGTDNLVIEPYAD